MIYENDFLKIEEHENYWKASIKCEARINGYWTTKTYPVLKRSHKDTLIDALEKIGVSFLDMCDDLKGVK